MRGKGQNSIQVHFNSMDRERDEAKEEERERERESERCRERVKEERGITLFQCTLLKMKKFRGSYVHVCLYVCMFVCVCVCVRMCMCISCI